MKQLLNEWKKYIKEEETLAQKNIYPKGVPLIKREQLIDPQNQFATKVLEYLDKTWKNSGNKDDFKYVALSNKGWNIGGYGKPVEVDRGLSGYLNQLAGVEE